MRTLDRYIVRSFLYSAGLWFVIMMMLRTVIDLFVNMDEFVKTNLGTVEKLQNIFSYYGYQNFVYLTELGGIIIVASAAFTLARMNHTNELTAMLASGVSLRRVVLPIILSAVILDAAIFIDEEYIIPSVSDKLVRDREGEIPGKEKVPVRLVTDSNSNVWYSPKLVPSKERMELPVVLVRDEDLSLLAIGKGPLARPYYMDDEYGWAFEGDTPSSLERVNSQWIETPDTSRVWTNANPEGFLAAVQSDPHVRDKIEAWKKGAGRLAINAANVRDDLYGLEVKADRLTLDVPVQGKPTEATLSNPRFIFRGDKGQRLGVIAGVGATWVQDKPLQGHWKIDKGVLFIPSDLKVDDIVLRQSSRWLDYMSTSDLTQLITLKKVSDLNAALLTRHIRYTEPLNNIFMLLLGLPFILSRERNIKASAALCLLMVAVFHVSIYFCRYVNLDPIVAAWLPTLIFGPVSIVMLDSVKT